MGASKKFLETMISQNQKQMNLRFVLMRYDKEKDDFVDVSYEFVEFKKLPNGMSNINGGITINTEQDVRTTLDIEVTNHDGINNWTAFFDDNKGEFKWWLDKRLKVFVGLRIDGTDDYEWVQMGYFIVTYFESTHNLAGYPVTRIQGSSKECLYATRRGRLVTDLTIEPGTVMTDAIRNLLIEFGEKPERIKIDPLVANDSISLEDAEPTQISTWDCREDTTVSVDWNDKAHGDSSFKFHLETNKKGVFATKTYKYPVDLSGVDALAVWAKSSTFIPDSKVSLWIHNRDGKKVEYSFGELVGNTMKDGKIIDVDTWRHMILRADGLEDFTKVTKLQLNIIDNNLIKAPFSLWIDKIYGAEIRNLLQRQLTYSAGDNIWNAIKELAGLLDCDCFYDDYGNFILQKRRYPQEMNTNEKFEYDAYDVLEPVLTYDDSLLQNNLYAGSISQFDEYELANHTRTIGGSTSSSVMNIADIKLTENGLEIREKGKKLNQQGKVYAIDQFPGGGDPPVILNKDTDVSAVWKDHKNHDAVVAKYPNGFPHLTEPPIRNFNIQRIGDFVWLANNGNPVPTIQFTYEAKNRSLYELRKHLSYCERLNITSVPYWILRGNDIIKLKDRLLDIDENYEVISINYNFSGTYMDLTVSKIENLIIDVPYFDLSGLLANACWYHYDFCGIAFTFAWLVDVFQMNDIFKDF